MPKTSSIAEITTILDNHEEFNFFINYLFSIDKSYNQFLSDLANFIGMIISNKDGIYVEDNIILCLWHQWFKKVQFIKKSEKNRLNILARSFIFIVINLSSQMLNRCKKDPFKLCWDLYFKLIEMIYTEKMNMQIYKKSIKTIGMFAAEFEVKKKISIIETILKGFSSGTTEYDILNNAYLKEIIKTQENESK